MDNSNMSKNRPNEYLGVNKIGKNIRKSPLHQPNFVNNSANNNNNPARQQPQPQVYNISKSDFRSIVQQLTGSPSRQDPLPRPPNNPPKHPSMRLQRIRPPPLTPINRPPMPPVVAAPAPMQMQPPPQGPPMPQVPFNNRPPPHFGQRSPRGMQSFAPGDGAWTNPALSPISAYMQQLQSCIGDGGFRPNQMQQQPQMPGQFQAQYQMQPQAPGQFQAQPQRQPQVPGHFQTQPQPPAHQQIPGQVQAQPPSPGLLPNPNMPPLPSPGTNGPALLPSPTSQFLLPSPSFFNMLSPTSRSPYPLLSPGSQFPPPLSPNFAFSPMGQSGILGPGPQPPLSPGYVFPPSPSGLFPISSPRWRDPSF
ncbi:hypothetical protein BVRB_5g105910 [Beta vulgaris subsp. vulgaris]|uniref:protein HAIKU1 n=1 Tax=Beta vulgaris subsp. vulgaris TaxID=3555 RepID=UPI00053FED34|nr:protein HAIKU1 [Beta vulgaris subsp. vulgaris]KMT11651.1 hypothetical protein BVRB_5g105910 [Beta vulgaris subsp. vulgaris]